MKTPSSSTPWIRVNPKPLPPPRLKRTSQAFREPPIPPAARSVSSTDSSESSWLGFKFKAPLSNIFTASRVFFKQLSSKTSPSPCVKDMRVSAGLLQRVRQLAQCTPGRNWGRPCKPVSTPHTNSTAPSAPQLDRATAAAATLHCTETDRYAPLWTHMPQLLSYCASNFFLRHILYTCMIC